MLQANSLSLLPAKKTRQGFTIIEMIVVCFIIGLLVAITTAAVQSARESSRRIQCINHLKQLGVALSHNAALYQSFGSPMPVRSSSSRSPARTSFFEVSGLYELLPALEERPIYDSINIHVRHGIYDRANVTALHVKIGVFLCPSDTLSSSLSGFSPINYRFNVGSPHPTGALPDPSSLGAFTPLVDSSPAQISDGLSTTVGMSERVIGLQTTTRFDPFRDFWYAGAGMFLTNPVKSDQVARICARRNSYDPVHYEGLGKMWSGNSFLDTWYNHVMLPNSSASDCSANSEFPRPGDDGVSAVSSRSFHTSAVNSLFLDGSVRTIRSSINLAVWRAMGTRSGSEVIGTNE